MPLLLQRVGNLQPRTRHQLTHERQRLLVTARAFNGSQQLRNTLPFHAVHRERLLVDQLQTRCGCSSVGNGAVVHGVQPAQPRFRLSPFLRSLQQQLRLAHQAALGKTS